MLHVRCFSLALAGLLVLALLASILVVSAEAPAWGSTSGGRSPLETIPAPTPEYPTDPTPDDGNLIIAPPQCSVACELTGGPDAFCPGWNLWYTLHITNTGEFPVTNLVIKDRLPEGVWMAKDGGDGTVRGDYSPSQDAMIWSIPLLDVDDAAVVSCVLHTYTRVPVGSVLVNTFQGDGFNLTEPIYESFALVADDVRCAQPTSTPSPTPEPTRIGRVPTPDGQVFAICVPMIVQ